MAPCLLISACRTTAPGCARCWAGAGYDGCTLRMRLPSLICEMRSGAMTAGGRTVGKTGREPLLNKLGTPRGSPLPEAPGIESPESPTGGASRGAVCRKWWLECATALSRKMLGGISWRGGAWALRGFWLAWGRREADPDSWEWRVGGRTAALRAKQREQEQQTYGAVCLQAERGQGG